MWIKYIQMKNFQNFKTGLKANEIEIDFSNRENTICLLVGPNGIGKTSFLSCLTPFATLGNLDIRDSNQLVIRGKNGYKKMIIMDGKTEYTIQHIYTASKDTHSVKSYIMKDGVELNPNGNVTSFKSLVSDYLYIDMDYLKLIRLGDNVTNLIKLKATDRKNFMSKFLDSVDIYLKYYQKISSDVKDLKLLTSHTLDKIRHLNIDDVDIAKEEVSRLKEAIVIRKDDLNKSLKLVGQVESKLHELPYVDKETLKELSKKITRYEKALGTSKYKDIDSKGIMDIINGLEKEISRIEGTISAMNQEKSNSYKVIEELMDEVDNIKRELENEKANSNILSLKDYLDTLIKQRDNLIHLLPKVSYGELSKDEVYDFTVKLKNIQHVLNTTYEFGEEPIKEAVKIIRDDRNVTEVIAGKLIAMEKDKHNAERTYLDKIIDKYKNIKVPECTNCNLVNMYNDIMMVKDLKPDLKKSSHSAEFWEMVNAIHDNLSLVISDMKELSGTIKKMPDDIQKFFILDNLFTNIKKCKMIYDDKIINELLSNITEIDNYNKLLQEISKTSLEINNAINISKIPYLESAYEKALEKCETTKADFDEKNEQILEYTSKLSSLKKEKEELEDLYDAKVKGEDIQKEYNEMKDSENKQNELSLELYRLQDDVRKVNSDIKLLEDSLKIKEMNINEFITLSNELEKTQRMYDELVLIKSSTSTKEGIPLLFIQLYLKNIKELANTLLDIVYDGEVYIQDFDITSTEFKIPFVKNGIEIPDIAYASQGEQSFLSMAISFALSSQNLERYNIPLLDEVDSTFDSSNRERFLSIIEHQNSIIHCEQEFVISHNNMFSQYPVDVIDFSNIKSSKFDIKIH